MKILDAQVKVIQDSRKKDTLEAHLIAREGNGKNVVSVASVPAGKSTGTHEAAVLEPKKAFHKLTEIRDKITGVNFRDQHEFDALLLALDGTENKKNLGGNLILSLSLAFARAFAIARNLELYKYIRLLATDLYELKTADSYGCSKPIFNVINGGAHVEIPENWGKKFGIKKGLDFQEFQVIPTINDFGMAMSVGREYYRKLGKELARIYGGANVILGDEAGYVCPFKTNEEALEIMQELISRHLYPLKIGLDAAASQFHVDKTNAYVVEKSERTPEELGILYYNLAHRYELVSLEDPYHEEAFEDFALLHKELPELLVVTDDLTTTNPLRLKKAIDEKSGNAILIKLNQIGTLSETISVVKLAYKNNWRTIVSHRSGETMDSFIADLAYAIGAWGLKSGSPGKPERTVKYNRLLDIWKKQSVVF
jgi:enolase